MKRKLPYLIVLLTLLPFIKVKAQIAPPNANFAYDPGIDTVWINSPYVFVNNTINDVRNYWRVTPVTGSFNQNPVTRCNAYGCFMDTLNRAFRFTFENVGTYNVTLVSKNNLGVDSITKLVYVDYPSNKPRANFYIDKTNIGNAERIQLYDLTQNGPTEWYWYLTPPCYVCDPNQAPNSFYPSAAEQRASFFAQEGGNFGICLVATNHLGKDTFCRPNYVEVIAGNSINAGQVGGLDTIIRAPEGYLYDNGGPLVNYFNQIQTNGPEFLNGRFYTIAPCASSITLNIQQFKFRPNDKLIVRASSKTGPILATLTGSNLPASQKVITANTDRIVLEWQCAPGVQQATDSGFVIKYTSVPATYGPPQAKFSCPDMVYSGYNVKYINESKGEGNLTYAWDADGLDDPGGNPLDNTGFEFETRDGANWTFENLTTGPQYMNVCLYVSNCKGTSQFCKLITVMPILSKPLVNFSSPRPAGFTTDIFRLNDETKNGALTWKWTITPNTFTYLQGTNSTSQNPIFRLNAQGKYNVKLVVTNQVATVHPDLSVTYETLTDSLEKIAYLDVISYGQPDSRYPIGSDDDIGITNVKILGTDLDTTTNLKTPTYDTIYAKKTAVIYRGVDYTIQVSRPTASSAMDRKIWIDTSLDGYFLAPGEEIFSEINQKTLTASAVFRVPNEIEVGRVLRMRVGISAGNSEFLRPDRADAGCFEDYALEIGMNTVPPTISLRGDSVYRVQVNHSFVEPGVKADDDLEGSLDDKYEWITNLDTTKVGFYYKKYFVKDLYGNVSDTVYRVIQVEIDRKGPKLNLNASDSIFIGIDKDSILLLENVAAKPTAVDYLGNTLNPSLIQRSGYVNLEVLGDYMLTWTIKDEFSLTDTVRQRIYVRDTTAPDVKTFDTLTRIVKHQIGTGFDSRRALILDDNYYSIDDLTVTRTGSVNENKENSYNLSYVVCDPSGNCSAPYFIVVEVKDTIKPAVTLLGDNPWIVDVYTTRQQFIDADVKYDYSDNYYAKNTLTTIANYNAVNLNVIGTYELKYIIRDGAGNETIVTRYVKVVDKKAPRIELIGGSTVELAYMDTFRDPGVKIIDNYQSDAQLQPALQRTTTLEIYTDPDTQKESWYGGKRGYKEVKYNVTDSSGNVAAQVIRRVYVDFRSGLADYKNNGELSVYPNPNNGVFTIKTKEPLKGSTTAVIYNILGAKVYGETYEANGINTHDISASQLKSGVYMLQITNNGKQYAQRIVIE